MDKLFDPFFTTKFTGRGLGLAVSLGIIKSHKGVITVKSNKNQGTTFRIYIPLSKFTLPPKVTAYKTKKKNTILVVDDERNLRTAIKLSLKHRGFSVIEATDGLHAIEQFKAHQTEIDCVICDLTMPNKNGWETLEELRKLSHTLPVILSSGYTEVQAMQGHHTEMPQAFLSKPYEPETLINTINCILKSTT